MLKRAFSLTAASACLAGAAHAGRPVPGAIGFQEAATPVAEDVSFFHNAVLMPIITLITLLVLGLLLYVMVRYNRRANPEPKKFSHNTTVEIVWTMGPVLILAVIAVFSFTLLFKQDVLPTTKVAESGEVVPLDADDWITIKAQGYQWAWKYFYTDELDDEGQPLVEIVSNPVHRGLTTDEVDYRERTGRTDFANKPVNLSVDYPMVVPEDTYIRYQTAAERVIHSWTVPAFGIKTDAIPGRLNEGWFYVEEPGAYYGQCSELCGINHAYMPIEVRVVPKDIYEQWYELVKTDREAAYALVFEYQPDQFEYGPAGATSVASLER